MALLEVRGLVKVYGRRAVVDGVSFEVSPGEVVGLLGPNGAGKTTSFRMTTGQIPPDNGRVIFDDKDVTHLPMYKRARLGMGYLSQEPSVFRKLTVEQNVTAILEALPQSRSLGRKLTRRERRERTDAVLDRFKLSHIRNNPAGRASGGEKRRLEIARCLVCEPMLILLDEPFAAVDPKTTEDIRQNIRDLASQGIGILLTDHNVREVLKITDRSYLIKDGKVVTHGTPQQLVRDQVAIDEYLGTTFSDESIGPARLPVATAVEEEPAVTSLGEDDIANLIERLRDVAQAHAAASELVMRGTAGIPALLAAMGRPDPVLRDRAFHVLKHIAEHIYGVELQFDAGGPPELRHRQLMAIRAGWERKAG